MWSFTPPPPRTCKTPFLAAANGADNTVWLTNGYYVGNFNFNSAGGHNFIVQAASKPAKPSFKNRFLQRAAFWLLMPISAAISRSCLPAAANKTTRARSTWRAGSDRPRAHCWRVALLVFGQLNRGCDTHALVS